MPMAARVGCDRLQKSMTRASNTKPAARAAERARDLRRGDAEVRAAEQPQQVVRQLEQRHAAVRDFEVEGGLHDADGDDGRRTTTGEDFDLAVPQCSGDSNGSAKLIVA